MSDHIERVGKKYFEESYLLLANQNAERCRAANERLRKELDVCEYVKRVDAAREEGRKEAAREALRFCDSKRIEFENGWTIDVDYVQNGEVLYRRWPPGTENQSFIQDLGRMPIEDFEAQCATVKVVSR